MSDNAIPGDIATGPEPRPLVEFPPIEPKVQDNSAVLHTPED